MADQDNTMKFSGMTRDMWLDKLKNERSQRNQVRTFIKQSQKLDKGRISDLSVPTCPSTTNHSIAKLSQVDLS